LRYASRFNAAPYADRHNNLRWPSAKPLPVGQESLWIGGLSPAIHNYFLLGDLCGSAVKIIFQKAKRTPLFKSQQDLSGFYGLAGPGTIDTGPIMQEIWGSTPLAKNDNEVTDPIKQDPIFFLKSFQDMDYSKKNGVI